MRRLLTLKWLGLSALAIALMAVMVLLGVWQWHRAQPRRDAGAVDRVPVAVETLSQPGRTLPTYAAGRLVKATGTFDAEHQLVASGRRVGSATGWWVLTPLRLADGSAVLVLRGLAPTTDPVDKAPDGLVQVTGRLQPAERSANPPSTGDSSLEVATVDPAVLAARVPYPLLGGFVVLTDQVPAPSGALMAVPASPPPPRDGGLHPVNLAYALQWWLFSAFVVVGWWRLLRDDVAQPAERTPEEAPVAPDPELDRRRRLALQDAVDGDDELAAYNRHLVELAARADDGRR